MTPDVTGGPDVTDPSRTVRATVADLAALIERASADLALAEEPSGFFVALESRTPSVRSEPPSPVDPR